MTKQLELLEKAIETGREAFKSAILNFAPFEERHLEQYGRLPNATPIGWTDLYASTNPDVLAYLDYAEEEGNEIDEMDRYTQLVIEVLKQDGRYLKLAAEEERILKEGL